MEWSIDNVLRKLGIGSDVLGLAMSGGGARGFAHVGVFMALERFNLSPHLMSGVSAGSIATVLYGAGLCPRDIAKCFEESSRFGDFTEFSLPKEGLFSLDKFARLMESWLPVRYLEEMKIPTVVCATDLDHGRSIGWVKGEIVPRVVASCSIPVIFKPKRIDGVNYVDGGVTRNLPAWAIHRHCTRLIGSNCNPVSPEYKQKSSILNVAMRSFQIMSKANVVNDLKLCDILIQPKGMSNINTFDISGKEKIILAGYDAACKVLEKHYSRQ